MLDDERLTKTKRGKITAIAGIFLEFILTLDRIFGLLYTLY